MKNMRVESAHRLGSACWQGLLVLALLLGTALSASAESKAIQPFNGKNLDGWKCGGKIEDSKWTVGVAKIDPANPSRLVAGPVEGGAGDLVSPTGHGRDLFTQKKFGDCTVDLEVMIPKGSNSGIYLMGEYEIQVLDSYEKKGKPSPGDMGGIYGQVAPKVNACGKPGEWQKYHIEFQAPRFEGDKKVSNGKFLKVILNDQVIHENAEVTRSTGGGVTGREHPEGPLMFQGNHGPVAFRNIKITLK